MKNLVIFLFGAAFGVGGTLLYLRREIKKELNDIREGTNPNEEEVPFTVNDEPKKQEPEKVEYHKIAQKKAEEKAAKMNDADETDDEVGNEDDDTVEFVDENDNRIYEIDADEFLHNHEYTKDRLVYYRGDMVMATESGTKLNPFHLVGNEWEQYVGHYADHTAFVRNTRIRTDYEIYVEECLYEDEYGVEDN